MKIKVINIVKSGENVFTEQMEPLPRTVLESNPHYFDETGKRGKLLKFDFAHKVVGIGLAGFKVSECIYITKRVLSSYVSLAKQAPPEIRQAYSKRLAENLATLTEAVQHINRFQELCTEFCVRETDELTGGEYSRIMGNLADEEYEQFLEELKKDLGL